jgi:hypothetical protein
MLEPEEYFRTITFQFYVPLSQLDYDIQCEIGTINEDFYSTREELFEFEGEDAECLEVPVILYPDLIAN